MFSYRSHRPSRIIAAMAMLVASRTALRAQSPLDAWNSGHAHEPTLTVRTLAPGFWVMRQSKLSNAEAPFMYLIAGSKRALLVDTGAEPAAGAPLPLRDVVDSLLAVDARRRHGEIVPLLVMHSHGHRDHKALDAIFAARPGTDVVPGIADSIATRFAITAWPEGEANVDLGGRSIVMVPTPGHEPAHLMFYDAATRTLLGGDMLYPGMLTVRDLAAFQSSAARIARFARTHPIAHILGAHVEMTSAPRIMYPLGTVEQFDEHRLALPASVIDTLSQALRAIGDFHADDVHADIILNRIVPLPRK
jgi:glyoxylase-like metal-dependent hydrolase (beta-lactamase superfamily II)